MEHTVGRECISPLFRALSHLAGGGHSQNFAVKQHVDIRFYAKIERMGTVGEDTIHAGPSLHEVHVVLSVCQHACITHVS